MEIKPTGPGGNLPGIGNDDQAINNKSFPRQSEIGSSAGASAADASSLASLLSGYKKADLQDPAKVEKMLSECAGGLLGGAADQTGAKLSADESSYLTGYLQNDPIMRGKLMSYLEQVLK